MSNGRNRPISESCLAVVPEGWQGSPLWEGEESWASIRVTVSLQNTLAEFDSLLVVDFLQAYFNHLNIRGLNYPTHIVGLDRQLAMAAIDQDAQVHPLWPAVIQQRIKGGASGAARVKDVIHQNHGLSFHGKRRRNFLHHGLRRDGGEVIAIEGDVQRLYGRRGLFDLLHFPGQTLG